MTCYFMPVTFLQVFSLTFSLPFLLKSCAWGVEPLMVNGDLEKPDVTVADQPLGWDKTDGLGVQWVAGPEGAGKAIRMDTALSEQQMVAQWTKGGMTEWIFPKPAGNAIAETYGLSLYSHAMPVEAGRSYRISVRYRGNGGAKVWVRGYAEKGGKTKRLYESVGACPAAETTWGEFTQDFNPTKHTPLVTTMKVMLFAYYPAGVSWFDDVKIVPLTQAEAAAAATK